MLRSAFTLNSSCHYFNSIVAKNTRYFTLKSVLSIRLTMQLLNAWLIYVNNGITLRSLVSAFENHVKLEEDRIIARTQGRGIVIILFNFEVKILLNLLFAKFQRYARL